MLGFYFLAGLTLGIAGGFGIAFRQFMRKYLQINNIIHHNRHRHPALILERVENHVRLTMHKRF